MNSQIAHTSYILGPVQNAFDTFMQEQCTEWGLDFVFTESLGTKIEETGFENLEYRQLDIPIGEWPKDTGNI